MGKSLLVGNGINIQFGGYMMSKTIAIKNRGGRNDYLDLLKAIAIVAVVFYHIGNLPRGYLGVDIFFVISGYFMMHGYMNNRSKPGYLANIIKRIIRFWPLILFCIVSCLIIGAVTMLPDDFENLGESAVASVFFMNNILSAITTRNYWNISNNYKPLMHLWYIGVLLQAYIVLPFVFTIVDKIRKQYLKVAVVIITVTSLLLFLCPTFSSTAKFYYLPFRIFEISCGCCICFFSFMDKLKDKWLLIIKSVSIILITLILIIDTSIIPDELYLLSIVVLTYFYVISVTRSQVNHFPENIKWLKPVTFLGKASFSIYIAHQPIIAFTRYLYMSDISGVTLFIVLLLILLISILSYQFFEKNIGNCLKQFNCFKIFAYMSVVAVIVCVSGLAIYLKAGVIRDVPELDVYVDSAYRGMNAEYVDIPYSWDEDFEDDKKIHILVIGDSMARDWCNILNESESSDEYEISYVYVSKINDEKYTNRLNEADYIFYACLGDSRELPETLEDYSNINNFYVVGIKNFGESNGQIYQKRFSEDYFESSIIPGKINTTDAKLKGLTYLEQNALQKDYYGEKYIDLFEIVQNPDGTIPVFTDTNKFISADTEHLTKNGCIYFAKLIDWSFIN